MPDSSEFPHLRTKFTYRPDIDGLRALAVIPVLLFHAGFGFSGGFVGVDIFFVISGYLITSLIAREMIDGRFTYKDFWERRIRRIFPPAVFVTILTVLFGYWALMPEPYDQLGKAAVAQVTMVANFFFWQQDGYFAGPSDLEPLLHMWSLAVEEQFYLILPFLLLTLIRRGQKLTYQVLILIFFASLIWSCYGVLFHKKATFFLLPARMWELLLGSLLALLPLRPLKSSSARLICALVGLGMTIPCFFLYDLTTVFPGITALPPCLGTALLIHAHQSGPTVISRVLSCSPVVFSGKISFSLYLWHWPLLVYGRHLSIHEMSATTAAILLVASFLLSILSWWLIETPFRRKKLFGERKRIFRFFIWSTGALAVLFFAVYLLKGFPGRFSGETARFAETSMEEPAVRIIRKTFKDFYLINEDSDEEPQPFLVWGDSHARAIVPLFQELCRKQKTNGYHACRPSTPPLLGVNSLPDDDSIHPHNQLVLKAIKEKKIRKVFLFGRWLHYYNLGKDSQNSPLTDHDSSDRTPAVVFKSAVEKTVFTLREMGVEVIIMKQVPDQARSIPSALWMAHRYGHPLDETGITIKDHLADQAAVNRVFDSVKGEGVIVIDPLEILSLPNKRTMVDRNSEVLYLDDNHLSKAGARALAPLFRDFIR